MMNLESMPSKKSPSKPVQDDFSLDDFDFKPITSGLGFHQQKTEVKPSFPERTVAPSMASPMPMTSPSLKKEVGVYQNDLSLFYNQSSAPVAEMVPPPAKEEEIVYRMATKSQRTVAYLIDCAFLGSLVSLVLAVMAKSIGMDLLDAWSAYPHEITPLVVVLFCGFFVIYFSIFEKTSSSTLGKNMLGLRVVNQNYKNQSFGALILRSCISLASFASLGLFSYFDLQNKVTQSKVIVCR